MQYRDIDKQALKTNGYRVLSKITIVGTNTVFTEDDCIVDWEYEDYRYVPNNGFIGQFVERIFDGNLRNISDGIILEDTEINLQLGIVNNLDLDEHNQPVTTWYDYGNFLVTKVQKTDTTGNYKFESADYTKKFNIPFETSFTYTYAEDGEEYEDTWEISFPCLASELAEFTCAQAGAQLYDSVNASTYASGRILPADLAAGNYCFGYYSTSQHYIKFTIPSALEKNSLIYYKYGDTSHVYVTALTHSGDTPVVTRYTLSATDSTTKDNYTSLSANHPFVYMDFTNADFVIESNQYDSDDTCRKVMQDIGKLAYSWVRVGEDNLTHIDFTPKATSDVDTYDTLTTDEYYTSKKADLTFGPVNKVLIGMGNVDGENMYKTSQDYTEETECTIQLLDNNLTNTEELRARALYGAERLFGITYTPIEINSVGHPWLEGDELIKLTNADNEVIYTYPFNRKIKYAGYIEGTITSQGGSKQNNKYEYTSDIINSVRKTTIEVDKQNQTITALASEVSENTSNISSLTIDVNGIGLRVQNIESTEVIGVTNEYAVNTSATTPPAQSSSSWSTTQPERGEGEYIWARIKTTYKEGNPTYSEPVNTTGDKGDPGGSGTPGASIDTITGHYAVSNSNTTRPSSGWTTDLDSLILTNENKYLWAYYVTTYTEGKSPTGSVENASVIGVYGDKGEDAVSYRHMEGTYGTLIEPNLTNLVKDITYYGDTTQETTSGYNLLPINEADDVAWANSLIMNSCVSVLNSLPNGTYRFIAKYKLTTTTGSFQSTDRYGVYLANSGVSNVLNSRASWDTSTIGTIKSLSIAFTINDTSRGRFTNFYLYGCGNDSSGGTGYADVYDIQISSGSEERDFQPYTYGPTPNPSYSQPINVVTGNQEVVIHGKNMFNKNNPIAHNTTATTALPTGVRVTQTASGTYRYSTFKIGGEELLGKKITIKVNSSPSSSNTPNVSFYWGKIGGSNVSTAFTTVNANSTTTLTIPNAFPEGHDRLNLLLYSNSNGTGNTDDYVDYTNLQIEFGETATEYSDYEGNVYNINLGKNLFDKTTATFKDNYYLNDSGTEINNSAYTYMTSNIKVNPDTVYSIQGTFLNVTGGGRIYYFDDTNTFISRSGSFSQSTMPFAFTTPSNCHYISFQANKEVLDKDTIQIEKGTYTTYASYFTPIELCKITDNYKDYIRRSTGINLIDRSTCSENKCLTWASGENSSENKDLATDYIKVEIGETYTTNYKAQVMFYDINNTYLGCLQTRGINVNKSTGDYFIQFTIPNHSDIYYVRLGFRTGQNNNLDLTTVPIQMEKGSVLHDLEPYGTGQWYICKNIGKVVLDGTQNISKNSTSATNYLYYYRITDKADGGSVYTYYLTQREINDINGTNTLEKVGCALSNTNIFYFNIGYYVSGNTTTDMNNYFSTHNLYIYYILATPTITVITNEDLISQLETIYRCGGYKYNNTLQVSSPNLPAYLDLDYWTVYKGETGQQVDTIVEEYALSTSSTTVTGEWSTTAPTMTSTNKYLWNRTTTNYIYPYTSETTDPILIGVYGETGNTGKGITSVTELYYVSNSSTAPSKPNAHVTTSSLITYNQWNLQCPPYTTTYQYFYTCSEILYTDGTYGWTNVTQNQGLALANQNAYEAKNIVTNIDIASGNLLFNYQKPKADTTQWTQAPTEVITTGLPETNESDFALRTNATTSFYVPYNKDKTYKIKTWLKTITSQASSTSYYYPSIRTYDFDKNEIEYRQMLTMPSSTTTLAQALNSGDTKVYLTSVDGFPTGTAGKGYYVGIFNYAASNGNVYETYTRNIYQFADTNDVFSNIIDTTNKTVTLKAAYTGSTIPAGTKVSCTQAGGVYFYPFSGIKYNATADWTYKEKIFASSSDLRLQEASYIRFFAYNHYVFYYGLSLTDYTEGINSAEVIIGTQTAATNTWTGNASFGNLADGQQIAYWLPYKSDNNVSLNLTLIDGTTTGAIPCYYSGTQRITSHYGAGNVVHLTYRVNASVAGTNYTGWWADANYDSNTYDRVLFNQNITAGAAIAAGNLIVKVGTSFKPLVASLAFDVTQPILYASKAISSGSTGYNNYLSFPSVSLRNTVSGITLTTGATCYLVGSLNGNTFTTKSSNMLTTTIPATEDGYYYISLGYMYSTYQMILFPEHPMYKFIDGEFKSLNQASYEANVKVDTLEIGGRNILRRTKPFTNTGVPSTASGYLRQFSSATTLEEYSDFTVRYCTSGAATVLANWLVTDCKNGETYTLSFWVKGDASPVCYFYGPTGYIFCSKTVTQNGTGTSGDGNTNHADELPVSSTEWQRVWVTWTLADTGGTTSDKYVLIRNDNLGNIYIAGAKLERGEKATDWTPANEDIVDDINDVNFEVNKQLSGYVTKTSYNQDWIIKKGEVLGDVAKEYVTVTDYGTFKTTAESKFDMIPDSTTISHLASEEITNRIGTDDGDGIAGTVKKVQTNFKFDVTGLEINSGVQNDEQEMTINPIYLKLEPSQLSFKMKSAVAGDPDIVKAYMSSNSFVLNDLNTLKLGKFAFVVRGNDSIDFKKIED